MPRFAELFPREWRVLIAAKNFVQMRAVAMQHAYEPVVVWWTPGAKPWRSAVGQHIRKPGLVRCGQRIGSFRREPPC
jgi:hypothetical protein